MDLSQAITYRGVNLNSISALQPDTPMQGYLVQDVRMPDVEGWGYREKRSLADGYDVSRVYLGMRRVLLRGTIYALTRPELHDKIRTIRALFTPTLAYSEDPSVYGYLPLTFSIPTEDTTNFPTGLIPAKVNARPKDQPGFFFPREQAYGSDNAGFSSVFEVTLECADPRIYAQSTTDIAVTATTGSGTATSNGDYPSPLNAILAKAAAATGASTITLTGFGTVMTVTVPASANDRQVNVDSVNKVVTLTDNGVETLRMDLISFSSGYTWPEVQPGDNIYSWTGTGAAPIAGSKLWYYETYA